jgi:hypothetical protein
MSSRRPWRIGALLAALLLAAPPGRAETVAPAVVATDTTWTAAAGPWRVIDDVTIAAGATLTLEPGAAVRLDEGRSLTVHGALVAVGTAEAPVTFGPTVEGARWGSLVFEDDAVDAVVEGLTEVTGGSRLVRCVLTGATRALLLHAASPAILDSDFLDNRYDPVSLADLDGGAALYVGPGSAPLVRGNRFEGNVTTKAAWGGAVLVDAALPVLQDNVFTKNKSAYGGALTLRNACAPIVGNRFEGNDALFEGGAMSLYSSCPALLNNQITGNSAKMDGGGVHVCIGCYPHANPLVLDNTITGNTSNDASTFASLDAPPAAAGVGAGYLRVFKANNVFDNTRRGEPSNVAWRNTAVGVEPDWVVNPDLSGNWWGSTDPAAIAAGLSDGADDARLGTCTSEPALTGPVTAPSPRATVTTRRIRYDTGGEPMPVFLTLYNPGPELAVDLVITLSYDGGAPLVLRDTFGLPGAELAGDALRVTLPENAAFVREILRPAYAPPAGLAYGTWTAVLFDAETGARIGDALTVRFDLAEGGGDGG